MKGWMYAVLAVYAILLRQGIPEADRWKWLTMAWLMGSIVLTFYYEADAVEKTNVPILPKKLETFEELLGLNFSFYSPPSTPLTNLLQDITSTRDEDGLLKFKMNVLKTVRALKLAYIFCDGVKYILD